MNTLPVLAHHLRLAAASDEAVEIAGGLFGVELAEAAAMIEAHAEFLNALQAVERSLIFNGGEDHPWIPGADAKGILSRVRAALTKWERAKC